MGLLRLLPQAVCYLARVGKLQNAHCHCVQKLVVRSSLVALTRMEPASDAHLLSHCQIVHVMH